MREPKLQIFAANATPALAQQVAKRLFVPVSRADITRFPDGEVSVRVLDDVRRGIVSSEGAARDYGVAVVDGQVDVPATATLRSQRPPAADGSFDFGHLIFFINFLTV